MIIRRNIIEVLFVFVLKGSVSARSQGLEGHRLAVVSSSYPTAIRQPSTCLSPHQSHRSGPRQQHRGVESLVPADGKEEGRGAGVRKAGD